MNSKIYLALAASILPLCYAYGFESANPGLGPDQGLFMTKLGELRVFFYDQSRKSSTSEELLQDISHKMALGVRKNTLSASEHVICPLSVLYPEPIAYNEQGTALFVDQIGSSLLARHSHDMKAIIDTALGISVFGTSSELNLILNFDGVKFVRDDFTVQSKFLDSKDLSLDNNFWIKDVTSIDWEMAKGTFSSTVIQDPESEDRFIFPSFPKEVTSVFFAEPAGSQANLGSTWQCATPPIDWSSSITPGSAKGKRIAFVLKGLVTADQIIHLESRSSFFPINRGQKEGGCINYPSGILIKELSEKLSIDRRKVTVFPDFSGTEIFQTNPEDNQHVIEVLQEVFQLTCPLERVLVRHIYKKGSGFTDLNLESLRIPYASKVVVLNQSEMPSSCGYFNLGQRSANAPIPWIQLYHLPPSKAMLVSADLINDLSLTPVEDIFYRSDEMNDSNCHRDASSGKITTKIDLFIFPDGLD